MRLLIESRSACMCTCACASASEFACTHTVLVCAPVVIVILYLIVVLFTAYYTAFVLIVNPLAHLSAVDCVLVRVFSIPPTQGCSF